jgi:hypothetical protein
MKQSKVSAIEVDEEASTVELEEEIDAQLAARLKPGKRVLVDSDQYAFIYILEDEEAFYAIRFEKNVWPALNEAHTLKTSYYVKLNEHTRLALVDMEEELVFLLENIRGNGNYGEAFEQAVNDAF